MKIAFINCERFPRVNLGPAYIISAACENHTVFLYDLSFVDNYEQYLNKKLREDMPDILCYSVNSFTINNALLVAGICKEILPSAAQLWGGVHPTLFPEETIRHPLVDYICVGEGEKVISQLLDQWDNTDFRNVPGIWRKKDNQIIRSSANAFIEDLDSLPAIRWDFWDMEYYLKYTGIFRGGISVLASRGCPYSCAYCSVEAIRHATPGRYYRLRNPKYVVDEMIDVFQKYQRMGARYICFDDACFGVNKDQLRGIVNEMISHHIVGKIPWICKMHPAAIDDEWLDLCKRGGCFNVSFGRETTDEDLRKRVLNKHVTNKKIRYVTREIKKKRLLYSEFIMFLIPGERILNSLRNIVCVLFSEAVKVYHCYYFPLPKTALADGENRNPIDSPEYTENVFYKARMPQGVYFYFMIVLYKVAGFLFMLKAILRGFYFRQLKFIFDIGYYTYFFIKERKRISINYLIYLERNTISEYFFQMKMAEKKQKNREHNIKKEKSQNDI